MLNIICGICSSNKLSAYDFDVNLEGVASKIVVPSIGNDNQEYYLILECEQADDDFIEKLANEHAEKLMDELEELECTDESFRKNCTLILCCESGRISDKSLLNFEENPYFFKKNVITYSQNELSSLRNEINNSFDNEKLNQLLMKNNGNFFEYYKTLSLEDGNFYSLLIKIFTKLPFVHYLPQPNQLENLETFVRSELDQSDLKLIDYFCVSNEVASDDIIFEKNAAIWGEL